MYDSTPPQYHDQQTCPRAQRNTQTATTQELALWCSSSCLDVSTSRVDPGQDPRYSRAWSAREAVGKSQSKHHRAPKAQPMSNTIPREMKVSHGSGAMGCETMAMVVRQTTHRGGRRSHAADPDADAGKDSGDAQPQQNAQFL